ncbi:MAG: hypothetical protein COT26_01605, partial [Candidatus Kerfeldbacteria bacterium CG08_land_8_20_14_0_20_43_14]
MAKIITNQNNTSSPSQVSGRLATWHRVMKEAGLTLDNLQKSIDDPKFRERLIAFWQSGGVTSTGELSFPTWKTITLGTHKDTKALFKALENAGVNIGDYARFMMKHSMFSIATTE